MISIYDFIELHSDEIDAFIKQRVPNHKEIDDEERRMWILNNEDLYVWAKSEGVDV